MDRLLDWIDRQHDPLLLLGVLLGWTAICVLIVWAIGTAALYFSTRRK